MADISSLELNHEVLWRQIYNNREEKQFEWTHIELHENVFLLLALAEKLLDVKLTGNIFMVGKNYPHRYAVRYESP